DLVFLDIQMPGFDGFSVIQGLMDVDPPLFVFVTAYGDHALRAFDAQAVDYLMKPVDEDRLAATMDRVRQRLTERRSAEDLASSWIFHTKPETRPNDHPDHPGRRRAAGDAGAAAAPASP
ncbi:MAG: response regulator, partial [Burkholderiaceae bacterium]